jgi:hypothetical protein
MTDPSLRFRGLRDGLTVIRIRSHLLHYRYRDGSTAPVLVPLRSSVPDGHVPLATTKEKSVSVPIVWGREYRSAAAGAVSSMRYPSTPAGTVLESGGVYIDLAAPGGVPFVALAGQIAGSRNRYVARRDVAVDHWNVLVSGGLGRDPGKVDSPLGEGAALGGWEDEGGALRQGEHRLR